MQKVIYQIKNLINNKLYIGSTINFEARKKDHINSLINNKSGCRAIQNAWNKYGKSNFIFEIIDYVHDSLDLLFVEEEYILLFDTIKNGYNIKLPYTERNMTEYNTFYTSFCAKEWYNTNAPNNLKKISKEEWLEKRSLNPTFTIKDLPKEKSYNSTQREGKEVLCVNEEGVILNTYRTLFQAKKAIGIKIKSANMSKCCKKNKEYKLFYTCNNFIWYFKEDFCLEKFLNLKENLKNRIKTGHTKKDPKDIIPYKDRNLNRTSISIKNIETGVIHDFISCAECAKFLNVKSSKIQCLKNGFQNKGNGRIVKVTNIKGYCLL